MYRFRGAGVERQENGLKVACESSPSASISPWFRMNTIICMEKGWLDLRGTPARTRENSILEPDACKFKPRPGPSGVLWKVNRTFVTMWSWQRKATVRIWCSIVIETVGKSRTMVRCAKACNMPDLIFAQDECLYFDERNHGQFHKFYLEVMDF